MAKRTHKRGAKHVAKARKHAKHEAADMYGVPKRTHKRKAHRSRKRTAKRVSKR